MTEYNVLVCDVCGSQSEPIYGYAKPESWYYGGVTSVRLSLPIIRELDSLSGNFCSPNCIKTFMGSCFLSMKEYIDEQCDNLINNN